MDEIRDFLGIGTPSAIGERALLTTGRQHAGHRDRLQTSLVHECSPSDLSL
jgi:hypothetical protein